MEQRGQFTFYRSFWEAVSGLPKKDQLPVLRAIILYALDGVAPEALTQTQQAFFSLVKPVLDSARKKAASGKQGGSKRRSAQKQPSMEKELEIEIEKEIEKELEIEIEKEIEHECDKGAREAEEAFQIFWNAYPKQSKLAQARAAWKNLTIPAEQVMEQLRLWKNSKRWQGPDGWCYIPCAHNFLAPDGEYLITKPDQAIPKGGGELGKAELEALRRVLAEDPEV